MQEYFRELNEMWEDTLEDHAEWLKQSKSRSFFELLQDALRVSAQIDAFEEKTEHMTDEDPLNEFSILAAKYKNRWIASRFLVHVLEELFLRFSESFADKIVHTKAAKKRMQDPKYEKVFEEYISQKIARYKKEYLTKSY